MSGLGKGKDGIIDHNAEFTQGSDSLFALKQIGDQDALKELHEQGETGEEQLDKITAESDEENDADIEAGDSGADDIEASLDELYNQYLARKKIKNKKAIRKTALGLAADDNLPDDEDEDEQVKQEGTNEETTVKKKSTPPLLVDLDTTPPTTPTERWFERDVFKNISTVPVEDTDEAPSSKRAKTTKNKEPSMDEEQDETNIEKQTDEKKINKKRA